MSEECVCMQGFHGLTCVTSQSVLPREPWVPPLALLKAEVNAAAVSWGPPLTLEVTYAM